MEYLSAILIGAAAGFAVGAYAAWMRKRRRTRAAGAPPIERED